MSWLGSILFFINPFNGLGPIVTVEEHDSESALIVPPLEDAPLEEEIDVVAELDTIDDDGFVDGAFVWLVVVKFFKFVPDVVTDADEPEEDAEDKEERSMLDISSIVEGFNTAGVSIVDNADDAVTEAILSCFHKSFLSQNYFLHKEARFWLNKCQKIKSEKPVKKTKTKTNIRILVK